MRCALGVIASISLALMLVATGEAAFAQSDLLIGTWRLNLSKSTYSPAIPAPRSSLVTYEAAGEGIVRATTENVAADGRATKVVRLIHLDGKSYPEATPAYDSSAYTLVDRYTVLYTRSKDGKVLVRAQQVISQDGKTLTFSNTVTDATGQPRNAVGVYEKQ